MKFRIQIKDGWSFRYFNVEQTNITPRTEDFIIYGKNKTIVLQSNRPLFRNRGLKHRQPDWKCISGQMRYVNGLEVLATAIMNIIEPQGKP